MLEKINTNKNKEGTITLDYSVNIKLRLTALAIAGVVMLLLGLSFLQLATLLTVVFLAISCYIAFELSYLFYRRKFEMVEIIEAPIILSEEEALPVQNKGES